MDDSPTYTFDWRLGEHAQVVTLLSRDRHKSGIWRVFRWSVVIVLAVATVATFASAFVGDFTSALQLGPLVVIVGGLTFWFEKWTGLLRAWQIKRLDPAVHHPITHAIETSSLKVTSKVAETRLKWEGLFKVRETPDLFLFYYSDRIAYYLPKRVIGGQEEVDRVRRSIREKRCPSRTDRGSHRRASPVTPSPPGSKDLLQIVQRPLYHRQALR